MEENVAKITLRYCVFQFDGSAFVVADVIEGREICVCNDYDEWQDAKARAEKIAELLNQASN